MSGVDTVDYVVGRVSLWAGIVTPQSYLLGNLYCQQGCCLPGVRACRLVHWFLLKIKSAKRKMWVATVTGNAVNNIPVLLLLPIQIFIKQLMNL